jgi:hypothetical protein
MTQTPLEPTPAPQSPLHLVSLELIDPTTNGVLASWQDTWFLQALKNSYQIDLLAELPQVARAENFNPEHLLEVCASTDAVLDPGGPDTADQVTTVTKFEDEMTVEDVRQMLAAPTHTGGTLNNRSTVTYETTAQGTTDLVVDRMLMMLSALVAFFDEAKGGTYSLQNNVHSANPVRVDESPSVASVIPPANTVIATPTDTPVEAPTMAVPGAASLALTNTQSTTENPPDVSPDGKSTRVEAVN